MFDNPDLFVCCAIGDGEAETGALATSWHSNKFLNPVRDGAEGSLRSHQVPVTGFAHKPEHIALLEQWMQSHRPEELFDEPSLPI